MGLTFPLFLVEFQELFLQTGPTGLFYFHDQKTPTYILPIENKTEKDEHYSRLVLSVTFRRRKGNVIIGKDPLQLKTSTFAYTIAHNNFVCIIWKPRGTGQSVAALFKDKNPYTSVLLFHST